MTAILTNQLRFHNATRFFEQAAISAALNMYLFIGKSMPWVTDENIPDTTADTLEDDNNLRYNLISLKKILPSNCSNVVPRFDWSTTPGSVFVPYAADDADLFAHPTAAETLAAAGVYTPSSFYCLTEDMNVYKCLEVPAVAGTISTEKPTGQLTTSFVTSDGYRWKYMYTVSASDALKYFTDNWIPVKTLAADDGSPQWDVQAAAVDGSILEIKITEDGSGYTHCYPAETDESDPGYYGTLVDGSGIGSSTFVLENTASASNDYYNGMSIYIHDGAGAGQVRVISDYDGASRTGTISGTWSVAVNNTSTYKILPTVTVTGDGTGCTAIARVNASDKIERIDVIDIGQDYHSGTAAITDVVGINATADVVISPPGGHGSNPVDELGGYYVMVNTKLAYTDTDFPTTNDYRQIGLIIDVTNPAGTITTDTTLTATHLLTLTAMSAAFQPDEEIISDGSPAAHARVVEYSVAGAVGYIRYFQDTTTGFTPFAIAQNITGQTSASTAAISGITEPDIDLFSGEIIYKENHRKITRADRQLEDIKITIKF